MRAAEGMTLARSMGPVAVAVRRSGGSIARVFRRVELPLTLLDSPDVLIPLRDQLRLVELAAREIGDEALPARLALGGGVEHLGEFGRYVCAAARLDIAIARCNERMAAALQSATVLRLSTAGQTARWTYSITDSARVGRQKNEVLALGYMLDLLTQYFGVPAHAVHAELPGAAAMADRKGVEQLFGCEIADGAVAALAFPAAWLAGSNRSRRGSMPVPDCAERMLPGAGDFVGCVEHIIALGLMERRPREDWLCRRLQLSRRELQRALAARDTTFRALLLRAMMSRAMELLRSQLSVTEIALELGYSDPAHFTRAFVRRFGESPRAWRERAVSNRARTR
jgi:AraC-like DNA-binding protein